MISKTFQFSLTVGAATILFAGTASAQRYVTREGMKPPTITAGTVEGKMDNKPYSASYLPRTDGPLSHSHDAEIEDMITKGFGDCDLVHQAIKDNAKKQTTEKFDAAVKEAEGTDPGLTAEYNANAYDKNAQYWEGFCHLWSPAGLDPNSAFIIAMDKIYANVPFGIGDLKELTTYNYTDSDAIFVGKRNYGGDSKKASENLDPVDLLTVFDSNVGPGKDGVVLDIDPGAEVWNQPFYSWKRTSKELTGDARKGGPRGYKHTYEVSLHTEYAKEGEYAYRGDTYLYELNWKMKVWTDKDGKIMKSSWIKDQSDKIPDFAWIPNVKNQSENYKRLMKIAKDGISVKDIEGFCKGMKGLTKDNLKTEGPKLAALLNSICPVLDQNKLDAYVKNVAEKTGIDYSALDSALNDSGAGNS